MASTFSPLLGIELIGVGDQNNTWGLTNNTNLGTLIEQAIAGTATIDVTSGNVTLTDFDGASDQARCAAIRVTGTPGASRNVIAPASSKIYVLANGSNASVVLKTSTSTGITIPSAAVVLAYFDTVTLDFVLVSYPASSINSNNTLVLRDATGDFGANIIAANSFVGNVTGNVTGNVSGALTGSITSATTATTQTAGDNSTKVATTAYVNSAVTTATGSLGTMSTQNANAVAITGGTLTGVTIGGLTVGTNATGAKTISSSAPSGGSDGDIWYQVS